MNNRDEHLAELFKFLDGKKIGESYRAAVAAGDEAAAISAAAAYFRSRKPIGYFAGLNEMEYSIETAERAVAGDVTVINMPHQFPDGRIDWSFDPTAGQEVRNYEWTWQLSRMAFWNDMALAFFNTGESSFAKAFNRQLRSWVLETECPLDITPEQPFPWNGRGSAWRSIETGIRLMKSWPLSFEVFRKSLDFTDENLCLMAASFHRQALHLRDHHRLHGNWMLMEMAGLYAFASFFDEFSDAGELRAYATEVFVNAYVSQILPDGMQNELSPDYHRVAVICASQFWGIACGVGLQDELPPEFIRSLEAGYTSMVNLTTPGLTQPRTNDCYTAHLEWEMKKASTFFPEREDFRWGATARKEGHEPSGEATASRYLPYAGFIAMRSSWDADALYGCFDVGPLGCAHIHWDKLNLNVYKGGDELLYDDGGGAYDTSVFRRYGRSSGNHNTVLVDGLMQKRTDTAAYKQPGDAVFVSNDTFDYARSVYDEEFGEFEVDPFLEGEKLSRPAEHIREVKLFKPDFFCVVDTLKSLDGKEHEYELRWQLDTLKIDTVPGIPGAWLSDYGKNWDVLIVPLCRDGLRAETLCGSDLPRMGGWFVGRNDMDLHKATTLCMTLSGKDQRFATLLIPFKRDGELPQIVQCGGECFKVIINGREYQVDIGDLKR